MPGQRRLMVAVSFLLIASAGGTQACGHPEDWVAKYRHAAPPHADRTRLSALRDLSAACGNTEGARTDRMLLPVLLDALNRGLDQNAVRDVFIAYKCLVGAQHAAGYPRLWSAFPDTGCPTPDEIADWRTITADGVLMREHPSRDAKRLGWFRKGATVIWLGDAGDWVRVADSAGRPGYVHRSLIKPYSSSAD